MLTLSASGLAYLTCGFRLARSILLLSFAFDEKHLCSPKGPFKFRRNNIVFVALIF